MSQYEIIQFLKQHPDKTYDYHALATQLNQNKITIRILLRKLRERNFVQYKTTIVGPTNVKKYLYYIT